MDVQVLKENIASIKRTSRLEVIRSKVNNTDDDIHSPVKYTNKNLKKNMDPISSSISSGRGGGGTNSERDYMEKQQQDEEINECIRLRLLHSISVVPVHTHTTSSRRTPHERSFLGCFIPFIQQILFDGMKGKDLLYGVAQSCDSIVIHPPANVICGALRCWSQYLLCGLGAAGGVDNTPPFESPASLVQIALLQLPLDAITFMPRSSTLALTPPNKTEELLNNNPRVLHVHVEQARSTWQVKLQALVVYLETFATTSGTSIETGPSTTGTAAEVDNGAVLIQSLNGLLDFVLDLSDHICQLQQQQQGSGYVWSKVDGSVVGDDHDDDINNSDMNNDYGDNGSKSTEKENIHIINQATHRNSTCQHTTKSRQCGRSFRSPHNGSSDALKRKCVYVRVA